MLMELEHTAADLPDEAVVLKEEKPDAEEPMPVIDDASPPAKAEDELDAALNGQEPTVKNLILAAIGVMKNRKARPDSKRISNWINRRYGRPMAEVEEELERLVGVGELARVDYKGSASFRIVQPEAKAKRRRRGSKPLGRTPTRQPMALGGVLSPEPMAVMTSAPCMAPLTLRSLVIEMLGDSAAASIESGISVTTQFIAKAVEASSRNIYRAAVLGNLDLILAKEVELGCFIKIGEDQYRISPFVNSFQQHHSLMALNPPLAHPPPAPVPVQQLMMDPQSRNCLAPDTPAVFQQPQASPCHMMPPPSSTMPVVQNSALPSDEQRKNDLIAAKLSKLEGKSKSPNKKAGSGEKNKHKAPVVNEPVEIKDIKKEALEEDEEDLPLTATRSNAEQKPQNPESNKAIGIAKKKKHSAATAEQAGLLKAASNIKVEAVDDDTRSSSCASPVSGANSEANSRSGSCRKKKSRKIFDPADHDQPARKRKAVSPVSSSSDYGSLDASSSSTSSVAALRQGVPKPREGGCIYCGLSTQKQRKGSRFEPLIRCNDCTTTAHPSCMDYSEKLIKKIFQSGSWQCTSCKLCHVCHEANEDDCMLFCDSCDVGYHMACHAPPIEVKPVGKWECCSCIAVPAAPVLVPNTTSAASNGGTNANITVKTEELAPCAAAKTSSTKEREEENARFLPILPPHLHPHTGLLPENWEDYEVDPHIPDVSEWEPIQIRDFFSKKGFSAALSDVFLDQEIDGRSLLLLHRTDVVSSLGLKLGPALKLFSFIKKLQTRRNFPDY